MCGGRNICGSITAQGQYCMRRTDGPCQDHGPVWVYVLSAARPGLCKVGMTTRAAGLRASELGTSSGYSEHGPYTVHAEFPARGRNAEAVAHAELAAERLDRRELFAVCPSEGARRIERALRRTDTLVPLAQLT